MSPPSSQSDRWAEWDSIEVPTLLITAEDGLLGDSDIERMATKPGVFLRTVSGAGHDVHLDEPATVARLIAEFVEAV